MITITTSNGISVRQGGIRSALGRIGFNLSKDIDEKTNIYLKANLLHEFGGGCHAAMADSSGSRIKIDRSFKDTWFEYGIGARLSRQARIIMFIWTLNAVPAAISKKIGTGMLVHAGLSNNLLK